MALCEFKDSPVCKASFGTARATQWDLTFKTICFGYSMPFVFQGHGLELSYFQKRAVILVLGFQ